jgi:YidC/Oxa1 family membrane protein insertase
MKTDKNTVIGFVLLAGLFFMYFWYNNKQQAALQEYKNYIKDSTDKANNALVAKATAVKNSNLKDTTNKTIIDVKDIVKEVFTTIENDLISVRFSNKGGQVVGVTLKKYLNSNKDSKTKNVQLGDSTYLNYPINIGNNQIAQVGKLDFPVVNILPVGSDSVKKIEYVYTAPNGKQIKHQFSLAPNKYNVDWNINFQGADQLLTGGLINFSWEAHSYQQERTSQYERQVSNVCFAQGNEFDYISAKTTWTFEKPIQWVGLVQQFFTTTIQTKSGFASGKIDWQRRVDSSNGLAVLQAQFQSKVSGVNVDVPLSLYYGPNDYQILKKQDAPEMDKIVNLGRDMYAFVRPINKYIIMPVFDFFTLFTKNYGWVVLLLTIFIRLVTSPLTYKSYLSSAKMKVLKPELDEIKKKLGDDQQGFAMEQMKLFREAGVSPLGGCLPALLQIPIFFALYSFFNSNIALRGQSFLWSHDLSSFDSIATLPFHIWGYGNHVSLFTLTAVITSIFISVYNMSMTPTQDNPALKYMPYIFPFMLLFIFNNLPSALTWYYTVSNVVTLLLQFIIQKYIINHDKILADIQIKRKTPKKKSNWQTKYEEMMEAQKKVQALKDKNKK